MNCRAIVGGAIAAGAASLALAGTAIAATPRSGGPLIPAKAGETLPAHGGTATSLNWSGYAVTPSSDGITAVNSSFVVPSTSTLGGELVPGFAATWTGIGGYGSSDLIQAGTSETEPVAGALTGGQYYAWYELLPAGETELTSGCTGETNCAVSAGDHVTVNIANVSGNTWSIKLTDAGKWTYAKTVTYTSSESSAEWILEAPTVGAQSILADVGNVAFGPTSTYTQGGSTHTIAQGDPTQLSISPSPVALSGGVGDEATPSALASDGQGFNACAYATSCPTPSS